MYAVYYTCMHIVYVHGLPSVRMCNRAHTHQLVLLGDRHLTIPS